MELAKSRYRLMLVTGQQMLTRDEYDSRDIRFHIRRGNAINCVTDAVQQSDRQRWTVNGEHVIAWRPTS